MNAANKMPEEVTLLIDEFLRDLTARGISVFGLAYRLEPEPAMAIMRNTAGDPASQAESMARIIKSAVQDHRIDEHKVAPLN